MPGPHLRSPAPIHQPAVANLAKPLLGDSKRNAENAQKFCVFITLPMSQAQLSLLIPYGIVNTLAANYIPPARLAQLPTAPSNT